MKIEGIQKIDGDTYTIIYFNCFSDELKRIIRRRLSSICHGEAYSSTGKEIYSYKSTLNEFLRRYERKTDKQKIGMIGELLVHIVISEVLDSFLINSPFFNMEERSVKKGFDLVLSTKDSYEIWINEVKSGELHKNKNSTQTTIDLLNIAKQDLLVRLNDESMQLWLNAINAAKVAISEKRDDKEAIIELLSNYADEANKESLKSSDVNVVLASTIFSDLSDMIDEKDIACHYSSLMGFNNFNKLYLLALQKDAYEIIYSFLVEESK